MGRKKKKKGERDDAESAEMDGREKSKKEKRGKSYVLRVNVAMSKGATRHRRIDGTRCTLAEARSLSRGRPARACPREVDDG